MEPLAIHLSLTVRDIDKALDFYTRVLGKDRHEEDHMAAC